MWYKDSRWDEEIGEAGETNYDGILVNPMTGALHGDILEKMAEVAFQTALDGFPVPELRQDRANFITNYTFSDDTPSFLKGFSVGGAIRWEDKMAAGYGLKEDDLLGWKQDLDNIYYAPAVPGNLLDQPLVTVINPELPMLYAYFSNWRNHRGHFCGKRYLCHV